MLLVSMMRHGTALGLLVTLACCGRSDEPSAPPAQSTAETSIAPGDEPLTTAQVGVDEVQTLPSEPATSSTPITSSPTSRPCGWSSAWRKDDIPSPMLAGVGHVPMPTRIFEEPILLPMRARGEPGEIVAEIVIGLDGGVFEATVIKAPEPRWPEAEEALLDAVRKWKYEPVAVDGTPVSVCSTLVMQL